MVRIRRIPGLASVGVLWALACGAGCGGGETPADMTCLDPLPRDCVPAYPPTWENLFRNEFGKTCGSSATGGSCHAAEGAMGGLVLEEMDEAHDSLLGKLDGRARVVPADPECSILMQRINASDPVERMPPGQAALPDNVRCAILQWIDMGAPR